MAWETAPTSFVAPPFTMNKYTKKMVKDLWSSAQQPFFGSQTWKALEDQLINQSVSRGFAPNTSSGSFRNSLANMYQRAGEGEQQRKMSIYQNIANIMKQGTTPYQQAQVGYRPDTSWGDYASIFGNVLGGIGQFGKGGGWDQIGKLTDWIGGW